MMGRLIMGSLAAAGVAAWRHYHGLINGPFEATHYLWSRGLALLCDHQGGADFVKRQRGRRGAIPLDPAAFANVHAGDLVWTRHIALPQFVRDVLPTLREPFALVTGDEDWAIPSDFDEADALLDSPLLLHWFTQNYDGSEARGKVSPIPIGLDFHTISNGRRWGHWPATPAAQEAELLALITRAKPNRQRERLAHADFQFNKHPRQKVGRDEAYRVLRDSPAVVFQQRKVRRIDLWEEKTRYAFVVSPRGVGLDTHRTWESLVLGNIVITLHTSLDPLFEGLPVVLLDDWSEITSENLARWHEQHADAFERPEVEERLTNRYWIAHMRNVVRNELSKR
jgi:hypothetical protein